MIIFKRIAVVFLLAVLILIIGFIIYAAVEYSKEQKKAAELLGITPKTLSYWESGKRFPTVDFVLKICELYHARFDDIIFLPEETA